MPADEGASDEAASLEAGRTEAGRAGAGRTGAGPGPVAEAEAWFLAHGLPYFVDSERRTAQRALQRGRLVSMAGAAAAVALVAGVVVGLFTGDASFGIGTAVTMGALVVAGYGATALRLRSIGRWAVVRTFRSLGLLFPLVTRALPLLLLFVTFLFINTEVWQVATSLDGGVLWVAVLLFSLLAVGFLLVRLPEEVDRVDAEMHGDRLLASLRGTPWESAVRDLVGDDGSLPRIEEEKHVAGFQRANLVLVLLVSQLVQVLLLAVAVLLFFLAFGVVAMHPDVIETWIGERPHAFSFWPTLSLELAQVSVFLAAFSGLYFTVYAVTDETYREQFFSSLTRELERAVVIRAVYRALKRAGSR